MVLLPRLSVYTKGGGSMRTLHIKRATGGEVSGVGARWGGGGGGGGVKK